jgi:hypothetical protein
MITKLGGSWHPNTADLSAEQGGLACSPSPWRADASGRLGDCATALLDCVPVVGDVAWYTRLWELGVRNAADMHYDAVVFLAGARFEFGRNLRDAGGAVVALIIPAYDDAGFLEDLVALDLDNGALGCWRGRAPMLGAENLYSWRLCEPLMMEETALDWIKADRKGVFVIDPQRASQQLRMVEPLGVTRAAFGRRMRDALIVRSPRIVVAENRRAA